MSTEIETKTRTMVISKGMARLLKAALGKSKYYDLHLVYACGGELYATNGKGQVRVGWPGQQLTDGMYGLIGDTLIYDGPVISESGGRRWPDNLPSFAGPNPTTFPIAGDYHAKWSWGVLAVCIQERVFFDAIEHNKVLAACDALDRLIQYNPETGRGYVTTYSGTFADYPVRVNLSYAQKVSGKSISDIVDVELWFATYSPSDVKPVEVNSEATA